MQLFAQLPALRFRKIFELAIGAAQTLAFLGVHFLPALVFLVHLLAFLGWQLAVVFPAVPETIALLVGQALVDFVTIAQHLLLIRRQILPPVLQVAVAGPGIVAAAARTRVAAMA